VEQTIFDEQIRTLIANQTSACQRDANHHCLTCSDEMVPVRVIHIDQETGLALVEGGNQGEEVDITLVEGIYPGDLLLVHGGVAIARLEEGSTMHPEGSELEGAGNS
jgi:hydrogenase maturation factor